MQLKSKMVGIAASAAMLLFPVMAMASTDITNLTLDGSPNATVDEGSTVNGAVTYDITSNDDVESASWQVIGSGLPKTCENIDDHLNSGTFDSSFEINTNGATEGTWDVKVVLYGTNDEGANQNCEGAGDDTMTFTDRLTINADSTNDNNGNNSNGNTGGNSIQKQIDSLAASVKGLADAFAKFLSGAVTPPAPATSAACTAYSQAVSGAMQGTTNSANIRLQGFLLSQGASIPALAAGASFGFWGPQTEAARSGFVANNHCI
jgi:hypothetical protein